MTPDGWKDAPVGEMLRRVSTGVSVNSQGRPRSAGEVGVLKTSAVTYGVFRSEENKVVIKEDLHRARENPRAGCVLLSRMNTPSLVGASAYVARSWPDLVLPDRIWQLEPTPEVIDGRWLYYVLSSPSLRTRLGELASGTSGSMKNLSQEKFLTLVLATPPFGEQRKIAAILSSVDDAIEATHAVIDQLQVVKEGMMAELLTRGLPGRHTRFKQTELGEVPEDWDVVPLGDLLSDVHAGWSPQCESSPAGEAEWGVLKVSAVSWDEFRAGENKRLPVTLVPRPEIEVKAGDLLVSRANTPELVGRSVYVAATRPLLMLSDKVMRLVPDRRRADPRFINFVLGAPISRDQIENAATGSSRSMKKLSQEKLRGVLVVAPPPAEQMQIMSLVDSMTGRAATERDLLPGMRSLKSALMSVLLTGEVRVAADEAAE